MLVKCTGLPRCHVLGEHDELVTRPAPWRDCTIRPVLTASTTSQRQDEMCTSRLALNTDATGLDSSVCATCDPRAAKSME